MTLVRPYRGVSAEERRSLRRERLVEAGIDLAGAEGIAGITIDAVCARAGLTKRYFYESFAGRDDLLVAMIDELVGEMTRTALSAIDASAPTLAERLRPPIAGVIGYLADDPRRAKIYVEAVASPALADRHRQGVDAYARLLVTQMLADRSPALPARRRERLELGAVVIVAGTSQTVMRWLDGTIDLSREQLVDEVVALCAAAAEAAMADA